MECGNPPHFLRTWTEESGFWFRYVMITIIIRISWQDLTRWLNDSDTYPHSGGFCDSLFDASCFAMTLIFCPHLWSESAEVRILESLFQAKWLVYIRGALSRTCGEHVSWAPDMDDIRFRLDIPMSSNIRTWTKLKQNEGDLHNPLFV